MGIGILETYSAPFRGTPKPPKPREFVGDPFVKNPGFQRRLQDVEGAYTKNLMRYLEREPGFTPEEINAMYELPAEQSKLGEQSALRQLNQGMLGGGGADSGARGAGRGEIMAGGMRSRADLRRQTLVEAAKAAMADRLQQLQAGAAYTGARSGMSLAHTGMHNQANQEINRLNFAGYESELAQYNKQYDEAMDFYSSLLMGFGMCWVARAVYGVEDPRWLEFRSWMLNKAPDEVRRLYEEKGPALAARAREDVELAANLREIFDGILAAQGG